MPAASQQLYAASNVINANPSDRIYELVMRQEPKQARMCGVGGKGALRRSLLRIDDGSNASLTADRRPIDPPPIVQLRVIDPAAQQAAGVRRRDSSAVSDPSSPALSSSSTARPHSDEDNSVAHSQSFLQNPYYFMFACLARPDDDAELHWLKVCAFSHLPAALTRVSPRTVARDAQLDRLYRLCIISRTPTTITKAGRYPQLLYVLLMGVGTEAGFFVFPDLSVRTEGSYRLKLSLFEVVQYVSAMSCFLHV